MSDREEAPLSYAGSGVDYDLMDPFKRDAAAAAKMTSENIRRRGKLEIDWSRGESAYLIETPDCFLAHVEEGLGTKIRIADAYYQLTGRRFYDHIAQDTVAMIVNDMVTVGAMPLSVAMHLAVGSSDWFEDRFRYLQLIDGWRQACDLARCNWGGGETPTLKNIIVPGEAVLAGSAMGIIQPKSRLIGPSIRAGDVILFLLSSGIHANGLTLAQEIAAKLPEGYLTPLSDGRSYGQALLDATHIYVPVVDDILSAGIVPHYAANITGHGWRKLMRATEPFSYIIDRIPRPQPVFRFMQEHGPVTDEEAYGNFNMGAGFALYLAPEDVEKASSVAKLHKIETLAAGVVETGPKRVVIRPLGLEYAGKTLAIR